MSLWQLQIGRYVAGQALAEGAVFSRWYGVAWYLPYSFRVYILPMPFNWIAGWCRTAYLRLRRGPGDPIAEAERYGYNRGYSAGNDAGLDRGLRSALELLTKVGA